MNDTVNIGNLIILSNCTNEELLDEVARRYNLNPAGVRDAIAYFMYTWGEMENARMDAIEGNDEEGEHGAKPF